MLEMTEGFRNGRPTLCGVSIEPGDYATVKLLARALAGQQGTHADNLDLQRAVIHATHVLAEWRRSEDRIAAMRGIRIVH